MKNKRQILTTILTVLISVFLVTSAVFAVTTIGTNIDTGGNLTVSGTGAIAGNTTIGGILGVTGNTTLTGDLAVNGGNITTTAATFNLVNTTATTVNFAGAATTLNIGADGALARTFNIGTGTGIDTINIGTGAIGADVITIGRGAGTLAIDTANWDVSPAGAFTGLTGLTVASGGVTITAGGLNLNAGSIFNLGATGATLTRVGGHPLTLTTAGPTNVTLPLTGTLATLAGIETLSGKTLRGVIIDSAAAAEDRILLSIAPVGLARFDGTITNADLTAARTWTLPDTSGTVTVLGNTVTGSGSIVLATSPTLVSPALGVATATSINRVTITAPPTSATLTIADGRTLTVSNSLTLAGTDGTTMTFPALSTTVAGLGIAQTFSAAQTFTGNVIIGTGGTAITHIAVYAPHLVPAATPAAIGTTQQTFSVPGLATTDRIIVNGPVPASLCPMTGFRVSAPGTLQLDFTTLTAAVCTPAAGTYHIVAIRN